MKSVFSKIVVLLAFVLSAPAMTRAIDAPTPDDVEALSSAARSGLEAIKSATDTRTSKVENNFNQIKLRLTQAEVERKRLIVNLRDQIDVLIDTIKQLEQECKTNLDQVKDLQKEIERLEREMDDIEKGRKLVLALANDRVKAAALIPLIQGNAKAAMLDFFKRESSAQDVEVREAKSSNGLTVVSRVGTITHCLSTNLQCSGKSYSLTN